MPAASARGSPSAWAALDALAQRVVGALRVAQRLRGDACLVGRGRGDRAALVGEHAVRGARVGRRIGGSRRRGGRTRVAAAPEVDDVIGGVDRLRVACPAAAAVPAGRGWRSRRPRARSRAGRASTAVAADAGRGVRLVERVEDRDRAARQRAATDRTRAPGPGRGVDGGADGWDGAADEPPGTSRPALSPMAPAPRRGGRAPSRCPVDGDGDGARRGWSPDPIERAFGRRRPAPAGERAGGVAAMYDAAGTSNQAASSGDPGIRGASPPTAVSASVELRARHHRVRRDRHPNLAPGCRPGSDRLDDRRADGRAEDDAEGQEGDLGRAHGPPCLPRA